MGAAELYWTDILTKPPQRNGQRAPRMSREASAQRLQSWVLGQSNLLQPLTPTAHQLRVAELRPILREYFDALDLGGHGTVSGPERD